MSYQILLNQDIIIKIATRGILFMLLRAHVWNIVNSVQKEFSLLSYTVTDSRVDVNYARKYQINMQPKTLFPCEHFSYQPIWVHVRKSIWAHCLSYNTNRFCYCVKLLWLNQQRKWLVPTVAMTEIIASPLNVTSHVMYVKSSRYLDPSPFLGILNQISWKSSKLFKTFQILFSVLIHLGKYWKLVGPRPFFKTFFFS